MERKQEFIALDFKLVGSCTSHVTVYCLLIKIPAVNFKLWMFSGMTVTVLAEWLCSKLEAYPGRFLSQPRVPLRDRLNPYGVFFFFCD